MRSSNSRQSTRSASAGAHKHKSADKHVENLNPKSRTNGFNNRNDSYELLRSIFS